MGDPPKLKWRIQVFIYPPATSYGKYRMCMVMILQPSKKLSALLFLILTSKLIEITYRVIGRLSYLRSDREKYVYFAISSLILTVSFLQCESSARVCLSLMLV